LIGGFSFAGMPDGLFDFPRPALLVLRSASRAAGFKVKIVGPGRQPGDFLSKAKESNQRRLCAALGISCSGWSVG
jgi:hypothetical protein